MGGIASVASSVSMGGDDLHVAALPGVGVALDELAQLAVAPGAERSLLAALGQPGVDRGPRALQGAVDRGDRRVERLGHPARREAEDLAQDEHRALARREELQGGDERELDALAPLDPRLRARQAVLHPEALVGVRVHPHRLGERRSGAVVRVGGRPVVDGQHAGGAAGDRVEADFLAIRYSQERRELRPSKRRRPHQARSRASCSASSASWNEPSMREQWACSSRR